MIGDVLNMRHPLTGGGMTVAFKDCELLANTIKRMDFETRGAVSEQRLMNAITGFYERRKRHSSTINILANALHRVFTRPAGDDGRRDRLRAACVEYLSMGGAFAAGPVGLLSGLTPAPWVLVAHFFAVAMHASKRALLPPTPTRVRQAYDLMHVACCIIMPLLEAEKATFLAWRPVQWFVNLTFPWRQSPIG
jgi:squalene monooxygenase